MQQRAARQRRARAVPRSWDFAGTRRGEQAKAPRGGDPARRLAFNEWCRGPESNWRHHDFQSCALPPELPRHEPDCIGAPDRRQPSQSAEHGGWHMRRHRLRRRSPTRAGTWTARAHPRSAARRGVEPSVSPTGEGCGVLAEARGRRGSSGVHPAQPPRDRIPTELASQRARTDRPPCSPMT